MSNHFFRCFQVVRLTPRLLPAVPALLLLLVLAAPLRAGQDQEAEVPRYCRTLLELINSYRQMQGLNSLRFDDRLYRLARTHSFAMFRSGRLSHQNFDERFSRSGSRMCVENVGWNHTTALKQFDGWRHSTGHDDNMRKQGITRAGIAEIGNYVTFFACQ